VIFLNCGIILKYHRKFNYKVIRTLSIIQLFFATLYLLHKENILCVKRCILACIINKFHEIVVL